MAAHLGKEEMGRRDGALASYLVCSRFRELTDLSYTYQNPALRPAPKKHCEIITMFFQS